MYHLCHTTLPSQSARKLTDGWFWGEQDCVRVYDGVGVAGKVYW